MQRHEEILNSYLEKLVQEQEDFFQEQDMLLNSRILEDLTPKPLHLPYGPSESSSGAGAPMDSGSKTDSRDSTPNRLFQEDPLPVKPADSHRRRRLAEFNKNKTSSKKSNNKAWRVRKAVERSLTVPCEFSDLKCSNTTQMEQRTYSRSELEGLGVRVVDWDG